MSVIPMEPSLSKGRWGCQRVDEDEEGYQEEDTAHLYQGFSCNIEGAKANWICCQIIERGAAETCSCRVQQVEGQACRKKSFQFYNKVRFFSNMRSTKEKN